MKKQLGANNIVVIACSALLLLVPGAIAATAAGIAPATVRAAQLQPTPPSQTSNCDELQVIFIADQSSSMGGYTDENGIYHPPTDPGDLRFEGPEFGVGRLILAHSSGYRDATIKVAAINFGTQPQVLLPWTEITPTNRQDADDFRDDLGPVFDPVPSMIYTVPGGAVEQAASLFAQQDSLRPQVDGCPRRLVILITDGLPFNDEAGFNWEAHLDDLAAYTTRYMPFPDYRLFVIGVDANDAFYEETLARWSAVTGNPDQVLLARSSQEMASLLARIIGEALPTITGTGAARGCIDEDSALTVPPYMQEIEISLIKIDPNLHLEVRDSTGRLLDDSQDDVEVTGTDDSIETMLVTGPQPGRWEVLTELPPESVDQCLVEYVAIAAEAKGVEPVDGARSLRFQTVPITFQIEDGAGQPLPDYNDQRYDLQMDVALSFEDAGDEQVLSLGANPGQRYQGDIIPIHEGAVAVDVQATALDDDGQSYPILTGAISHFRVDPVYFIQREGPDRTLSIAEYSTLPLEYAVVDAGDRVVKLDAPVEVELTHIGPEGNVLEPPSLLENGGVYSATLALDEAGPHTLIYTATVQIPAQGNQPATAIALASDETTFDVFPVTLLRAEFVGPSSHVATDPFLRPTGIQAQVRLVDEDGRPVSPASTGVADPTQIFKLEVRDSDGEIVLEGADQLVTTGEPGVFRLKSNELGIGEYALSVEPIAEVDERHAWAETEWTASAAGLINTYFYGVAGAATAVVALLATIIAGQVRVRQHPLSGSVRIYEKRQVASLDGASLEPQERALATVTLPNKNKYVFRPNAGGINKVVLTCPNEQISSAKGATAVIHRQGHKPSTLPLTSGNPVQIAGTNLYIVKDRRAGGSDGSQDTVLAGEFKSETGGTQ